MPALLLVEPLAGARMFYARCPECYRTELTVWSQRHNRATGGQELALALGAKRVRCAACRCNFVSFRLRKKPSAVRVFSSEKDGLTS